MKKRRSERLLRKTPGVKTRIQKKRNEWLRKRGRMIFLNRVETRPDLWYEGDNEDCDYWTKKDVCEVRTLLRGHVGKRGEGINAVLVGLDKNPGKPDQNGKKCNREAMNRSPLKDPCVNDALKIFGWVQKKKSVRDDDLEWQYARNAKGDEDDTTIDMGDVLVQEEHPACTTKRKPDKTKHGYIKNTGKVPLNIVCVTYERPPMNGR